MTRTYYFRTFMLLSLWLLSTYAATAASTPYYSNNGQAEPIRSCPLGLCVGDIDNPNRAADANLNGNFATLRPPFVLGSIFPVSLRLGMSGTVPRNYRAGVVIGSSTGLSAIGAITLRTYLKTGNTRVLRETRVVTQLAQVVLGTTQPGRVEFVASESFNEVEIEAGAVLGLGYSLNVYYAYGIDANVVETARGVVSRFPVPTEGTNYSTAVVDNGLTVCANSGVLNPDRAVDQSLSNFATFVTLAGVSCPSTLKVKLEASVPGGYYAGFVVGQQGVLDLDALGSLRITTFLNGEPRETVSGLSLLKVAVLPNGQQQISFPTNRAFDEVQITRSSAVAALNNLNIFYGFGLEPSVFEDQTPILSSFPNPAGNVEVRNNTTLCLVCDTDTTNVVNPTRVANTNLNDFAVIRTGLVNALSSTALRINLNGEGLAGNAAGVVLNQGAGLLNTQVLNNITIRTYDDAGQLLEAATGQNLLNQSLLADGRVEVFFNTTQNFSRVEVEVSSAAAVLARTRVYYAFAEDRPNGFPLTISNPGPLPVELAAFDAKAAGQAVDVAWRTASETNNSHFIVERALRAGTDFKALGRVEGAGTASGRSYSFRDETAGAAGVATLYYRLRQVDADGTATFSPVAVVTLSSTKSDVLAVYPNPAVSSNDIFMELATVGESVGSVLKVFDVRGVLLRQLPATEKQVRLAGEPLPAGLYNIVLTTSQGQPLGSKRLIVTGR